MTTMRNLAMVAVAGVLASPLPAQVIYGDGTTARDRIEQARRRAEEARNGSTTRDRIEEARRRTEEARTRARIDSGFLRTGRTSSTSSRVPPGHLPPRGMCRLWIDGVPPGQQPPVTDCATAERMRLRTANSRVIYGDQQSFPGKGKGKFKNRDVSSSRSCSIWDQVIVGGRTTSVCRDDRASRDGRDRGGWFEDDDDRFENQDFEGRGKGKSKLAKADRKAGKAKGKGKHGR